MAQKTLKFALTAADIPFISTQQPRSVVVGELDAAGRLPRDYYGSDASYDYNTLQVVYAENILPAAYGWTSVGYVNPILAPKDDLDDPAQQTFADLANFHEISPVYKSDPNNFQGAGHTQSGPLPTNSETVLLAESSVVFPPINATAIWRRFPVARTDARTKWTLLDYYSGIMTAPAFLVVGKIPENTSTSTAIPSGVQFLLVPSDGIYFVGTTATDSPVPELRHAAIFQHAHTVPATLSPIVESSQYIFNLPVEVTKLRCMTASAGYLILAWDNVVAWALLSGNRFDFASIANAAVTGSDSRIPEDLIGDITCLAAVPNGFIIFSERNAVAAIYSATNFANPWTFREISGCGGVRHPRNVTSADSQGAIFAITSSGLQRITLTAVQELSPACSDFLTGRALETYDTELQRLEQFAFQGDLRTRCALVGGRYLQVSVGYPADDNYQFVLVYDLTLKRWGKLRFDHRVAFPVFDTETPQDLTVSDLREATVESLGEAAIDSLVSDVSGQYTDYRHQIGLLNSVGAVWTVTADAIGTNIQESGRIMFGSYQLSRNRTTELHSVELEGVRDAVMEVRVSYDGRNLELPYSNLYWTQVESKQDYAKWAGFVAGTSFALAVVGKFNLSTVLVTGAAEGTT